MISKICNRDGSPKVTVTNEHPSDSYPILLTTDYPQPKEESFFYIQLSVVEAKALVDALLLLISEV